MRDRRWIPVVVLSVGALLATLGVRAQRSLPLRAALGPTVPAELAGYRGRDGVLSDAEARAAGVSDYLLRIFDQTDTTGTGPRSFFVYVGYYDRQTQGRTIHSPKNCLPGAGWEPLANQVAHVATAGDTVQVNRYLLQNGNQRALVLYWYQGRGRVAHNEFAVKWDLLRDAALRRRSEEALVRVVVFVGTTSEADAHALAVRAASQLVPAVRAALPG